MIIDLILERKGGAMVDKTIKAPKGMVAMTPIYNARRFYNAVVAYNEMGFTIASALDSGTEQDVKRTLCEYITVNDYNLEICDYINSVEWLQDDKKIT